jgi:transposase
MTEWNLDEALEVRDREAREEVVKNALEQGLSIELIQKITGLSIEDIERLAEE